MSKPDWKRYRARVVDALDLQEVFESMGVERADGPNAKGWCLGLCPFHGDSRPSFGFNVETGVWKCLAGADCGRGSVFDFYAKIKGVEFFDALVHLGKAAGVPAPSEQSDPEIRARGDEAEVDLGPASTRDEEPSPLPEKSIRKFKHALRANERIVNKLQEERGLKKRTMSSFDLGWCHKRGRLVIPVRDQEGEIRNLRFHLLDGGGNRKGRKTLNLGGGRGRVRLYGADGLARARGSDPGRGWVLVVEGELDRIIVEQEGFVAVSSTGGCASFKKEWGELFDGLRVAIVYDKDQRGQEGVRSAVIPALLGHAKEVRNVELPVSGRKDDKDVTDWFVNHGRGGDDLLDLIEQTLPWGKEPEDEEPETVDLESFTDIENPDLAGVRVRCKLTVCGETSEAFHAPEQFRIEWCSKDSAGECPCIMKNPYSLPHNRKEYVGCCMASDGQVQSMLRAYACKFGQRPRIEVAQHKTVTEFFAHQMVQRVQSSASGVVDESGNELIEKRVYSLSQDRPQPGNYEAEGWVTTHPKTQQVTMLIESLERIESDYEQFRVEDHVDDLMHLKSVDWKDLIAYLRDKVIRIYGRDQLILANLLVYLSPRWLRFNAERIRGWLTLCIVGDPGCGKSMAYDRLSAWIGVGDTFSGLTGSRTGLTYGLSEHKQKGWQVRIGRYPANSGRILSVDEAQFLQQEDIRTLSKGMEEGFIQIDRISSRGYKCQTRLIMIANPRRELEMDSFAQGIISLRDLLPAPVIRRLDFAVMCNVQDTKDLDVINRIYEEEDDGRFSITGDQLRSMVYWAWSLTEDQIEFTDKATKQVMDGAGELGSKYAFADDIPLVNPADIRKKIARMAAAFAVLFVSTGATEDGAPDPGKLVVKVKHVKAATRFLDSLYSMDNCALDEYAEIKRMQGSLSDYEELKEVFLGKQARGAFKAMVAALRNHDKIQRTDLAEQLGVDAQTISNQMGVLRKYSLVSSGRAGYVKLPKFNRFLRKFLQENPNYLIGIGYKLPHDDEGVLDSSDWDDDSVEVQF